MRPPKNQNAGSGPGEFGKAHTTTDAENTTPAVGGQQRFEVIVAGRRWNSYDEAATAEAEAARLRSHGFKAYARDRRKPARRPRPFQFDLSKN